MLAASVTAGTVISVLFSAFVTGILARFALPGPDPMPAWLTILIGLGGWVVGGGIALAAGWRSAYGVSTVGFVAAVLLVIAYRRFVQKRPLWGPEAYHFPKRGVGVRSYRERLQKVGIDPDRIGTPAAQGPLVGAPVAARPSGPGDAGDPTENPAHYLGLLEELHDSGVLDDDEYEASRRRLLERLR